MSANLNYRKGQTSFAYNSIKGLPWHKMGQSVEGLMTSEECLKLANLDFKVETVPVYTLDVIHDDSDPGENIVMQEQIVPNTRVIRRSDTHQIFTYGGKLVTDMYEPYDNKDAFNFVDKFLTINKAAYETAGAIGEGEIVFLTATTELFEVTKKDIVQPYLFIALYHNGANAIKIGLTHIRVVCQNTLNAALESGNSFSIVHKGDIDRKLEIAMSNLNIVQKIMQNRQGAYQQMVNTKMTTKEFEAYVAKLLLKPEHHDLFIANAFNIKGIDEIPTRTKNIINGVKSYYYNGVGQSNIMGTVWGAFNAITGYSSNIKNYTTDSSLFKNMIEKNPILTKSYSDMLDFCKQ